MIRKRIILDERSDPDAIRRDLRSTLAGRVVDELAEPIEDSILSLYRQGMDVVQLGNSFNATRQFQVADFDISVIAKFGPRPSVLARVRQSLGL
jgi:hypothetical protein